MIIFSFVGVLAIVLTLFLNVYTICLGRLIFGICGGVNVVALPRMVEETVPSNKVGMFGIITNLSMNAG